MKDPWRTGPIEPDPAAFVDDLPAAETVSVRLDDRLDAVLGPAPLGRPTREGPESIVFRRSRRETGRVAGPARLLDLLEVLLGQRVDEVASVVLPRDLDQLRAGVEQRTATVTGLLQDGRRLVEEVERLVCALYGLPEGLTDEVVAHAVRRAAAGLPTDGDSGSPEP